MNRSVPFDSPFLLGFEHTRSLIERAAKAAAEGYPPYNVEDRGCGEIRITLAVAGFTPDQLEVSVEDRQLTVAGRRDDVAAYFKASGLTNTGFTAVLPAGLIAVGKHQALVRVVAADGKGYYDGIAIAFEVK